MRCGVRTDVCRSADLGLFVNDHVVMEIDLSARRESGRGRFLENAHDPFLRVDDEIAGELGAIDSYESDSTEGTLDRVVTNGDSTGFEFRSGRTEVGQTGGASGIDGTGAGIVEGAVFDGDVFAASFELYSGSLGVAVFSGEGAIGDR